MAYLLFYDISNFKKPVLTGSVAIPSTAFTRGDLAPFGKYVYMASFDSIYVVDVSKPAAPKLAKVLPVQNSGSVGVDALTIERNSLFARTPFSTEVYNIANPKNPVFTNSIPNTHAYSAGLAADTVQHRLFTPWLTSLQEYLGFDVYDISNPSSPQFLFADSIPFGGGEFGVTAYSYINNVLYLTSGGRVNAFDVSSVSSHGFVTSLSGEDVPNSSVSVQVKDSVFFNVKRGGFEVLKYTASTAPFCPASMNLKSRVENTTAYLKWDKPDGAKGYIVRYKLAGADKWSEKIYTKANKDTLTNLLPNRNYVWNVKTVCKTFPPFYSTWARRDEFFTTAKSVENLISLAPNPVNNVLRVHVKSADVSQLIVTDLGGSPVAQIPSAKTDNDISFAGLRTGTYLLQLLNNKKQLIGSAKIFKQ